jgi:glycosyltransferase involved in cell wall biosynthesis
MITIVCSSQYPLDEFKKHVIKTSGLYDKIEFLGYENKGEFSLTEIYNRGLKEAKYKHVVFLHHDISIETKQWGNKLLKMFEKHPQYGILGVAGTKQMPVSGRWWETPRKMFGRVAHTHEGKTWLSTYSNDLNQEIEETVTVDGVFFAIDKTKIKKPFNEEVNGFHFYDVTFCFENYLEGVKIGVTTVVRINHKSIGMTNDEWENNRQQFAEKFKNNLPVDIKKIFRKGESPKVLIGTVNLNFGMVEQEYIFDLIKKLKNENCDITLASAVDKKTETFLKQMGVKIFGPQEPPGGFSTKQSI